MEKIIDPVDVRLIKQELTSDKLLRKTNKANNELYIFTAQEAPNTMREIGRLREIAFRTAGGGTGLSCDIDKYDTMDNPYKQLIVWNPDAEEIIGGYRYIHGSRAQLDDMGQPLLATAHMFHFSEKFIQDFLPYTLELGRSFVRIEYQSTLAGNKGLFALDNLWDGLGALTVTKPNTRYFFGKVTMYTTFDAEARNLILYFINKHFPDKDNLIRPYHPLEIGMDETKLAKILVEDGYKEDYKILNSIVREKGFNIPPLINAYMGLSSTMRCFGTSINDEFGDVEETGLLVTVSEISENKYERHIQTYLDAVAAEKN
jgi:hypothetical protein